MFGLSALATKAIGAAVLVLVIFGAGFGAGHHWEAVALEQLKTEYATEKAAAIEAVRAQEQQWAKEGRDAVVRDANNQAKVIASTKAQLAQVQQHVKGIANSCVTLGAVRLYNSAITGRPADSRAGDPGGDDARPSGIDPATFAASAVDNLGKCRQVIERQRSLIGLLRQYQAAAKR